LTGGVAIKLSAPRTRQAEKERAAPAKGKERARD